jgi:hypothetical protein
MCENDVKLLQNDLENVLQWSEKSDMALHKDKFEYMCHRFNGNFALSGLYEHFQYPLTNEITLEPVHQLRDLGILVSSDLSWSPHIRSITNKARQKASWVLGVFHTRSATIMTTLYKYMVRCLVEYCYLLWHPVDISDIKELVSVQNAFTARIAGLKDMHYWDRLVYLYLMSLQRIHERFIIRTCGTYSIREPTTIS